jgi:hypothetical protein
MNKLVLAAIVSLGLTAPVLAQSNSGNAYWRSLYALAQQKNALDIRALNTTAPTARPSRVRRPNFPPYEVWLRDQLMVGPHGFIGEVPNSGDGGSAGDSGGGGHEV